MPPDVAPACGRKSETPPVVSTPEKPAQPKFSLREIVFAFLLGSQFKFFLRAEIAAVDAQMRAGHPGLKGLCLRLSDWSRELRLIQKESELEARKPAAAGTRRARGGGGRCYWLIR